MWWLVLMCLTTVTAKIAHDTAHGASHHHHHHKAVPSRLVHIEQGPVRGYKAPDGDFFVFYGVPYATAPTGRHRFKAPLPPPTWRKPLEAVDKRIICPQKDYMGVIPKDRIMKEDCLIATIYVPDTLDDNIPVVVYVHGGAYLIAFGDYVTPRNFAKTKRVILVTFNYRLAAHGFLCLGTKDVPGNAGMKDQVALLRWVQRNIANFGGNPDDVTLAGYSAGSAAVDTLMISKMAKGLFHRVIPQSGVSLGPYNIQNDPLDNAKRFARMLNFTNVHDLHALEEFYKTASFEVLNSINTINNPDSSLVFCPCVERDVGVERFLEKSPFDIITSGDYEKVLMLYGFTTMEGLFRMDLFDVWSNHMNKKFSDFLPGDLKFKTKEEKNLIAKKVKHFYFGDKPVSPETVLGYVDYFTDVLFVYSTMRSVKLHVEAGHDKIYFYEYVHVDEDTIKIPYTDVRGPDHCAQTWAVLDGLNLTHTNERLISNNLREMKNITREIWLNFMETGNPVPAGSPFPAWPVTGPNGVPHMALDKKLEIRDYFERRLEKRFQFWDEIYKEFYSNPIPPQPPRQLTSGSNELRMEMSMMILILVIQIVRVS
ncbi:juvenile hormone esterase-like isoform X1 [Epargyreus clarus]|uniref:juvenile hormone esterase-like isoform X1 n=2 Tax=Epargyreus clarus TaxID=520877 RepID=UPI003C2EF8D0